MRPFVVQFLGEPEPGHPAYWAAGETGLSILLFANDDQAAEESARQFARLIHMQVRQCHTCLPLPMPLNVPELPEWARRIEHDGIAFCVRHLATGA